MSFRSYDIWDIWDINHQLIQDIWDMNHSLAGYMFHVEPKPRFFFFISSLEFGEGAWHWVSLYSMGCFFFHVFSGSHIFNDNMPYLFDHLRSAWFAVFPEPWRLRCAFLFHRSNSQRLVDTNVSWCDPPFPFHCPRLCLSVLGCLRNVATWYRRDMMEVGT